jgi:hypothetical protein
MVKWLYSTEAPMHGEAEKRSDDRRDNGPSHIAEVLAELLLQLHEMDTEAAQMPVVAA